MQQRSATTAHLQRNNERPNHSRLVENENRININRSNLITTSSFDVLLININNLNNEHVNNMRKLSKGKHNIVYCRVALARATICIYR